MDSQTAKGKYNQNNSIKFETESIKSSLCDYSDSFISVKRDIKVTANNETHVGFQNCASFSKFKAEINDVFIDEANHIQIAMSKYNLIEYSDNYSGTSGILRYFKLDGPPANNVNLNLNNDIFNSKSFKYKAALVGKTANAVNNKNSFIKNTKILNSLK